VPEGALAGRSRSSRPRAGAEAPARRLLTQSQLAWAEGRGGEGEVCVNPTQVYANPTQVEAAQPPVLGREVDLEFLRSVNEFITAKGLASAPGELVN
jgi:hypothetical protein